MKPTPLVQALIHMVDCPLHIAAIATCRPVPMIDIPQSGFCSTHAKYMVALWWRVLVELQFQGFGVGSRLYICLLRDVHIKP